MDIKLKKDVNVSYHNDGENNYFLNIGKEYRYLGEVLESLPKGCFINKTLTGCGGSTLAIVEDNKTVVAVPRLLLVENKKQQHKNLFDVHGGVKQHDLESSVKNNQQKYICTYDSLSRLVEALGDKVSEYDLLVDEVHVVIREAGEFRADVSNRLIDCVEKFKSVTYLTATPTNRKYLPPSLSKLPFLTVNWEGSSVVELKKCKVNVDLNAKVTAIITDIIDNNKGVPFVFYNSLTGIIGVIKLLQKLRKWGSDDIKIICANTPENVKKLNNSLGKSWIPQSPVTVDDNGNKLQETHKVIFVTKACFEGVDFYCERARTIVVSDAKRKHKDHIKLDISIDLPQIIGRFRDQIPEYRKEVIFLWTEMFKGLDLTEVEFGELIKKQLSESPVYIQQYETNLGGHGEGVLNILKSSVFYVQDANGKWKMNDLAYYAMMSAYEAQKKDFHVYDDSGVSVGEKKLDSLFSTDSNFTIPCLSVLDKKAMNRIISPQKLLREYCNALLEGDDETVEHLEELTPELPDIVDVVGIDRIMSYNCQWKAVNDIYNQELGICELNKMKFEVVRFLNLEIGYFYSFKELKDKVVSLYEKYSVTAAPKATDILNWYECKKTNKRGQHGYVILK